MTLAAPGSGLRTLPARLRTVRVRLGATPECASCRLARRAVLVLICLGLALWWLG